MGYYTVVEVSLKVKPEKLKKFRKKIEELKAKVKKDSNHWFWYYGDIEVDEEGCIVFSDEDRKWYEEEKFYDFIKGDVEEGDITGRGEEFLDVWRIVFDGKGNWKMQGIEFMDGKQEVV